MKLSSRLGWRSCSSCRAVGCPWTQLRPSASRHMGAARAPTALRCAQIAYTRSLKLLTFGAWWKAGVGTFLILYESIVSVGRSGRIAVSIFYSSLECCCLGFEGWRAPCWRWVLLYLEFGPGIHSGWSGVLISILSGNQNEWKENWGAIQPLDFFCFFFSYKNQILSYCSGIMGINKSQCICAPKSVPVSFVWYRYFHFLFIFN